MRYPKPLLFVYDQQSEIFKLDILLKEPMCSDYDICLSGPHILQRLFQFFSRLKAADDFDGHRKTAEPLDRSLIMLIGKDCRRAQKSYLSVIQDAFHRCTHGDFRFSISHISTKKPVHGNRCFHVLFDFVDTAELIVGLFVLKVLFKLHLPIGIRRKSISFYRLPLRIQSYQLLGHFSGSFFCPLPRSCVHGT